MKKMFKEHKKKNFMQIRDVDWAILHTVKNMIPRKKDLKVEKIKNDHF